MLYLPALSNGETTWRLPLTNGAAVCLANALLDEDAASQRQRLHDLLADEPALLLWCICRAVNNVRTLSQAANWLALHANEELQKCSAEVPSDGRSADQTVAEKSANLASIAIADSLSCDCEDEEAYLCALLSKAEEWLDFTVVQKSDVDQSAKQPLPDWLVQAISTKTVTSPTAKPRINAQNYLRLASVRQRWFDSLQQPSINLPVLLQHLRRLQVLEANFAKTLESEKLDSLKELAYGASHEINNPLANIATRAQTLLRDERDPERRRKLATINAQAFRAHEMISDMMLFARPPQLRLEDGDLVAIAKKVIDELSYEANLQNIRLALEQPATPIIATIDREQIAVVIKALCRNSLEVIGRDGEINVELEACEPNADFDDAHVAIRVHDTGPGISDEVRRHLFDPFYSGREAGRGLGFGLSKSWRIVTLHRGKMDVQSELGEGTTFTIQLPARVKPVTAVA